MKLKTFKTANAAFYAKSDYLRAKLEAQIVGSDGYYHILEAWLQANRVQTAFFNRFINRLV